VEAKSWSRRGLNFQFIRFWYWLAVDSVVFTSIVCLSIHSFLILVNSFTICLTASILCFQFIRFWYSMSRMEREDSIKPVFQFIRFWYKRIADCRRYTYPFNSFVSDTYVDERLWYDIVTLIFQFIRFWYKLDGAGQENSWRRISFNSFVSDTYRCPSARLGSLSASFNSFVSDTSPGHGHQAI